MNEQDMKQLSLFDKEELSCEELDFIILHERIIQSGTNLALSSYDFARNLKEMKDKGLFKEAGFNEFDEYVEQILKMKKSQVYNYIKIAEKFQPEFFQSIGKDLGMTKLLALTAFTEDEAKEFVSEKDVENITVKELKEEISKIKLEKKALEELNNSLTMKQEQLSLKLDETVDQPTVEYIEVENTEKLEELQKKINNLENEKEKLSSKLKLADNSKKDQKTLSNELNETKKELEALKKKSELLSNQDFNNFKVMFSFLQHSVSDIKKFVDELRDVEFQNKCKNALNALFEEACYND